MKTGTCKHFTGMMQEVCDKGVCYRNHVGGGDYGWFMRTPCIKEGHHNVVPCDLYEEPTAEEIAAYDEETEIMLNRMVATFPLCDRIKREHKGQDWAGVDECPVCGGVLNLTHAAYNGHVHGRCETEDCVSWME